ncbi:MAG: S8 family peptidase [Meiothermus sp.]|nr:S8 family peptidase [Meiothermus sp.]
MRPTRRIPLLLLMAALMACGGSGPVNGTSTGAGLLVLPTGVGEEPSPDPGGTDITGTLTAFNNGSLAGSVLLACYLENGVCDRNSPKNVRATVVSSASSLTYRLQLAAGLYRVEAFKDVNGDGEQLGLGDWYGCFGQSGQQCATVLPPKGGVNVAMGVYLGVPASRAAQNSPAPGPLEFVPGEVIVKFRPGVSLQSLQGLSAQVGGQRVEAAWVRPLGLPETGLFRASLDAAQTLELIAQLGRRPDVVYAEPNYLSRVFKAPNDPLYPRQWHHRALNLEAAWEIANGTAGAPVTVAVIDTGSINHPDLSAAYLPAYDFVSSLSRSGDGDARDPNPRDEGGDTGYHGGHVAGIIAARSNNGLGVAGVSWGVRVLPVRTMGTDGAGASSDILDGVRWAAGLSVAGVENNPNPARVINMSLGGKRPCSATEQAVFTQLKNAGVVIVVAAGNEGINALNYAPASCNDVITVGATGPRGERAHYSNYGPPVDVMAPGGDTRQTITVGGQTFDAGVLSTVLDGSRAPAYTTYNGTSMAAPHIAGVVALMLSREPGLAPEAVLARLRDSAAALSSGQCNSPVADGCGAGLVDASKAVGGAGPAPTPPQTGTARIYVAALFCANSACTSHDEARSKIIEVSGVGQQISFQIPNLVGGTYEFAGWQDLDGNQKLDGNDGFGFTSPLLLRDNQTRNDILIRLKPFTTSGTNLNLIPPKAVLEALQR